MICSLDSSAKICPKQVQKQQISAESTTFKLEKKLECFTLYFEYSVKVVKVTVQVFKIR